MKKLTKKTPTLKLNTETVRHLVDNDLVQVNGGRAQPSTCYQTCMCPTEDC